MTFIWLIVWLVDGTPRIVFDGNFDHWNNWAVALAVCVALDLMGGGSTARGRL